MSRFIKINDYGAMCEDIKEGKTRQAYVDLDKIESIYERRACDETYIVSLGERIFIVDENDFKRIISQLDIVNEKIKDPTKEPTQNEPTIKSIPRGNIPKQWKWIARDLDGSICLYAKKPFKNTRCGMWDFENGHSATITPACEEMLENPFADIKWEDSEPTMIEE